MANRVCLLCKKSSPMVDMLKLGKSGFVCNDYKACISRRLEQIRAEDAKAAKDA